MRLKNPQDSEQGKCSDSISQRLFDVRLHVLRTLRKDTKLNFMQHYRSLKTV